MRLSKDHLFGDLSLGAKGLIVLGAPVASLLLAFALVFWVEREWQIASMKVEHTLRTKQQILEIWLAAADAEAEVRRFLLTGGRASLSPYRRATQTIAANFDRLATSVADDPVQVRLLAQLRPSVVERFAIQSAMLTAAAHSGESPPQRATSRSLEELVRSSTRAMLAEEDRLLAGRTAERSRARRKNAAAAATALALGLLGCLLAYRVLVVGIVARVQRVRERAVHLARRVSFEGEDTARDEVGQLDRALLEAARLLSDREATLRHFGDELESSNRRLIVKTDEAELANLQKSEFLSNMSHELRTPLNAILGFGELLHDGKQGVVSDLQQDLLNLILTSGRHLLELINGILDLAKVEAGKMELAPERVDLVAIFGVVTRTLSELAARKRLRVESLVDPAVRSVVTDPAKLTQVLLNYLSNAIKFTPVDGRIWLRALATRGGCFRIEVEDTGPGIAADQIGKLFTPFSQVGTTERQGGTGLGLALTRRIVEAQGGHVSVRAAGVSGSLFSAVLPLGAESAGWPALSACAETALEKASS